MDDRLICYQTSSDTGEYLGENYADQDPLTPGEWLIPGGCYLDAPPEKVDGKAIVRTQDKLGWEYVDDNRGVAYSKETLVVVIIDYLGPIPDTLTKIQPPSVYHKWIDGAWKLDDSVKSTEVRGQRDYLLTSFYDKAILMAQRELRIADESDSEKIAYIHGKITELDAYAIALQNLPEQEGFPFEVTWPEQPVR